MAKTKKKTDDQLKRFGVPETATPEEVTTANRHIKNVDKIIKNKTKYSLADLTAAAIVVAKQHHKMTLKDFITFVRDIDKYIKD